MDTLIKLQAKINRIENELKGQKRNRINRVRLAQKVIRLLQLQAALELACLDYADSLGNWQPVWQEVYKSPDHIYSVILPGMTIEVKKDFNYQIGTYEYLVCSSEHNDWDEMDFNGYEKVRFRTIKERGRIYTYPYFPSWKSAKSAATEWARYFLDCWADNLRDAVASQDMWEISLHIY